MILGIESSCDESALAIFDENRGIVWEALHSQVATHAVHGGVVPELAVREHVARLPQLMARIPQELWDEINKIAVTVGPGLAGSLAMGMALGKAIALQRNLPLVGVNHLRAHAWSVFMKIFEESVRKEDVKKDKEKFAEILQKNLPHLGLLVSGGNTLLYEVIKNKNNDDIKVNENIFEIKIIARTVDDAAGECLDKVAKMMELPYPGAPLLEKLAVEGDAKKYEFPVPFKESAELAFSFSGLKTAMRYKLQAMGTQEVEKEKHHLAASFQYAVVEGLSLIMRRALKRNLSENSSKINFGSYKSIGLCGGVAQNMAVRGMLEKIAEDFQLPIFIAEKKYCGDNAAMVAWAAWVDDRGTVTPVESFDPSLTIDAAKAAR